MWGYDWWLWSQNVTPPTAVYDSMVAGFNSFGLLIGKLFYNLPIYTIGW